MPHQTPLGRMAERLFAYLNQGTEDQYVPFIKEEFLLLQEIHKILPQCVLMTCPVYHISKRFISANCTHILGYDADYFTGNSVHRFFSHIHPDDLADIEACFLSLMHSLSRYRLPNTIYTAVFLSTVLDTKTAVTWFYMMRKLS